VVCNTKLKEETVITKGKNDKSVERRRVLSTGGAPADATGASDLRDCKTS
jgi:hypothetical protein